MPGSLATIDSITAGNSLNGEIEEKRKNVKLETRGTWTRLCVAADASSRTANAVLYSVAAYLNSAFRLELHTAYCGAIAEPESFPTNIRNGFHRLGTHENDETKRNERNRLFSFSFPRKRRKKCNRVTYSRRRFLHSVAHFLRRTRARARSCIAYSS